MFICCNFYQVLKKKSPSILCSVFYSEEGKKSPLDHIYALQVTVTFVSILSKGFFLVVVICLYILSAVLVTHGTFSDSQSNDNN